MLIILSFALLVTLGTSVIITLGWGNVICKGKYPTSLLTFVSILFTSGLDVGLIMFPLTEFPIFEKEPQYAFANPLAIEFGFWGFLVWASYFLTTFYFCIIEPRVKLFELPMVKLINNLIIISTCAFTGYLFLSYLPDYIAGISDPVKYSLVFSVILLAVFSSTEMKFVRILSVSSTGLFFVLIYVMWLNTDMGITGLGASFVDIGEYFTKLYRFITPMSDIHRFYLFWWFAWSIMIGQFVARFVGGIKAWQLLLALLVLPSIPIALWFSVLYHYYVENIVIAGFFQQAMVFVGIVFVINSIDSLTRLYTTNLNLTVERLGKYKYILVNCLMLVSLTLLYQFTPFEIDWVGLVVIGIYAFVYYRLYVTRQDLAASFAAHSTKQIKSDQRNR